MNFVLEHTKTTPNIQFNNGKLLIRGNSFPVHPVDYYDNFLSCLQAYVKNPLQKTEVIIDVNIINAFTKRSIMKIFRLLETIDKSNRTIAVYWLYEKEDDDMLDLGFTYQSLISLPFDFVMKIPG